MRKYVEYTPEWWNSFQRWLKFDDKAKADLIGLLMRTRPLTLLFAIAAVVAFGVYVICGALR